MGAGEMNFAPTMWVEPFEDEGLCGWKLFRVGDWGCRVKEIEMLGVEG